MEMKIRLYLMKDGQKFMGIGVLRLLQQIPRYKSLRKAAQFFELSYSKALRMVGDLETALGCKVLDRHHGGNTRDGAALTPFGESFILLYDEFQKSASALMDQPFIEFSEKLGKLQQEVGNDTEEI